MKEKKVLQVGFELVANKIATFEIKHIADSL